MRRVLLLAGLVLAGLGEREARAGSCEQPLAGGCINSDTLWPTAGPTPFASLPGTLTTAPGQFSFGLVSTYLMRPVAVALPSPGPTGTTANAISDQVNGNFLFGYGVTDRLELNLAVPVTFIQSGAGSSALTGGEDLRDTALRDARFGMALAIVREKRVDRWLVRSHGLTGSLTARMNVSAPSGDRSQFAGERSGVLVPSLAFNLRFDRFFAGGEVGARIRGVSAFDGARIGTQAQFGLGVGAEILPHELLSLTAEARALPTFVTQYDETQTTGGVVSTATSRHLYPAEWMFGVRTAPTAGGDFTLTAGAGTGIDLGDDAVTRPRLRVLFGVAYAPRGYDSDGDGVLDRDDACPTIPGVKTIPASATTAAAQEAAGDHPTWRKGCPKPPEGPQESEGPAVDFSVTPPGTTLTPTPAPRKLDHP